MSEPILESDEVGKHCPKCDGEMMQGFILDHTYGAHLVASWIPGAPESSFWRGTKSGPAIPIGTLRCSSCGFLESYAQRRFAAH